MKENFKQVKFFAHKDIKKDEMFSLYDVLSKDQNLEIYNELINIDVNNKVKSELFKKEEELLSQLKNKELVLKQELTDSFKRKYNSEIAIYEEDFKSKISNYEEKIKLKIEKEQNENLKDLEKQIAILTERNKGIERNISLYQKLEENLKNNYEEKKNELINSYEKKLLLQKEDYEDKLKSPTRKGLDAEVEVIETLKQLFNNDDISKPNASIGEADILHKVKLNGNTIGTIYYEIKNRNTWVRKDYENFANKIRNSKNDFNIYIAKALPKGKTDQHIKLINDSLLYDEVNNIYLISFEFYVPIVFALRKQLENIYKINGEKNINESKYKKIYDFFQSAEFENYFLRMIKNISGANKFFDDIQKSSIKGKGELNSMSLEIENLKSSLKIK